MKILVNAIPLKGLLTGISRYVRQLYTELEKLPGVSVSYFDGLRVTDRMPEQADSMTWAISRKAVWRLPDSVVFAARCIHQLLFEANLRRLCGRGLFDLYHETTFFPAALYSIPQILTIYDLSLLKYASSHPRERIWFYNFFRKRRMPFASRILTISDFIKGEINSSLGISPEFVDTVHLAPAPLFSKRNTGEVNAALRRLALPQEFLLFVGSLEPRKNLPKLIEAMKIARSNIPLVLAGWEGWGDKEWLQTLKGSPLRDRIFITGHVSEEDLAFLYSAAKALVYPSLYEGFGLPVLEAMACGCPVICSKVASLPEVAGDAALFIDPADAEGLAQKIELIVNDQEVRKKYEILGKARANYFSWKKNAENTFEVFMKATQNRK